MGQFGNDADDFPEDLRPKRPAQPFWLSIYLQCKQFSALLYDGGVLDQPVEEWRSVMTAGNAYESWIDARRRRQEQEALLNAKLQQSMGLGRV